MGVVYKAEDPSLDRIVALKTIRLGDEVEGRKEYESASCSRRRPRASSPTPTSSPSSTSARRKTSPTWRWSCWKAPTCARACARATSRRWKRWRSRCRSPTGLGFAHEFGVVHRDIKPGNIMLLERGAVKIMDFGIARMRHADHKTSTGMVLGTPRYMSPEQIGGQPVDQRSDIFSLGIVLLRDAHAIAALRRRRREPDRAQRRQRRSRRRLRAAIPGYPRSSISSWRGR